MKWLLVATADRMVLNVLLCVLTRSAIAQQPAPAPPPESDAKQAAIRVVHDPHTGVNWLLERTPDRPGGPGRMIPATLEQLKLIRSADTGNPNRTAGVIVQPPVIRAGDRIIVEERTAVVEARLAAIALGPAKNGAPFNARLAIGGKVLRVTALGPGRAAIAEDQGISR